MDGNRHVSSADSGLAIVMPNIKYHDCVRDSPKFRTFLEDAEGDVEVLETRLEKMVKLCNAMVEAGKAYNMANRNFITGVRDLAGSFDKDDLLSSILDRCTNVLQEVDHYHMILLDQAQRSVSRSVSSFVKEDVSRIKETRKHFEKVTNDFDQCALRSAQSSKSKPLEAGEAANQLSASATTFTSSALDYVFQFNSLNFTKKFTVLDSMLDFMNAQNTFFHQGSDLFSDLEPFLKEVVGQLVKLRSMSQGQLTEMKNDIQEVKDKKDMTAYPIGISAMREEGRPSEGKDLSGYLFKRTTKSLHKSWVRRWFAIYRNQLKYRKRSKDTWTVMEEDLRLCIAKPLYEIDRRYCFEIISPKGTHTLQADTEEECQLWISCITEGVSRAYQIRDSSQDKEDAPVPPRPDNSSPGLTTNSGSSNASGAITSPADHSESAMVTSSPANQQPVVTLSSQLGQPVVSKPGQSIFSSQRVKQFQDIPGNELCCDCGGPDPRWSSINLGITLCIECSGIHRSFGVHVSKVRSLTLDAWEPEILKIMAELGNSVVNNIYESSDSNGSVPRASPNCGSATRVNWITAKYVQKAFVKPLPKPEESGPHKWSVQRMRSSASATSALFTSQSSVEPDFPGQGQPAEDAANGSTDHVTNVGDVVIFGSEVKKVTQEPHRALLEIEASAMSGEAHGDGDDVSTTSYEDLSSLTPDVLLCKAAKARNLPVMLHALALGAKINAQHEGQDGKTPLILAVETGSLATSEFLMLNGAKVDVKDNKARSPLHHAALQGHTGHVCQLLKKHANQHAVDIDAQTPLSIAVSKTNADIVTLLRLAKLNEEMRESEGYDLQQDETFNEVFKDFAHMASHTPEKLNRSKQT